MKKLIVEILTFIIGGLILFPLVSIIGILYTLIKHIVKFDYSITTQLMPIIRSATLASDGFACASAGELLNDVFKPIKIRFGKWHQTISAVTGLIFLYENKDIKLRSILDKILGENHCIDAITEQDNYYYNNN